MPIRINLLAEAQAADELRRRDPVKRAIWGGGFLVFLILVWSGVLQSQIIIANATREKHEAEWKRIEKDYLEVSENLKRTAEIDGRLAALTRLSTNRFLWGAVLDSLQQAVIEPVQLVRFRGDQTYIVTNAPVVKTAAAAKTDAAKVGETKNAKPPPPKQMSLERVSLTLEAKDYGNSTDQNHDRYKNILANHSFFKTNLPLGGLRLKNWIPPTAEIGDTGRQYMLFSLEMQFPEVRRDE